MYHPDQEHITLEMLRERIEATDMVPSRTPILVDMERKFNQLKENGYTTLFLLRKAMKNSKNILSVSKRTGLDQEYLILLRREIESYFPKPHPLSSFEMEEMRPYGHKDTRELFEAMDDGRIERTEPAWSLADLSRVQWVSPNFAKMLYEAGYHGPRSLSGADPKKLCGDIEKVNIDGRYFKGKIGLRDVKRLIGAACFTVGWT